MTGPILAGCAAVLLLVSAANAAPPVNASHPIVRPWMRAMTLRQMVAQLIVAPCFGEAPSTRSKDFKEFDRLVRQVGIGGLIVINRVVNGEVRPAEPYAMAAFLNRMQRSARIPLIVGADFERGASMRVASTTKFPHAMAFGATGDPRLTKYLGEATAREARALGVHWVFAPVADVNNNPENPIINIRSFGEAPAAVASHVAAFIEGAHSNLLSRVLVTAKQFPGHGDTAIDSHIGMPSVSVTRERLGRVEFVPFRAAIAAGVDAIMSAHISAPALGAVEVPATVSRQVLTGVLRKELRFTGLVVTDAMDMQGLVKGLAPGEAAVRAIDAGADVLLMPPDPERAIEAILAAVREKRISRRRIEQSVAKILRAKVLVGLNRKKLVQVESIGDTIDSPESTARAQEIADRAVTLVKNGKGMAPIAQLASACLLILTEGRHSAQGRRLRDEFRMRAKETTVILRDPAVPPTEVEEAVEALSMCPSVYVAAFASVAAYRGNTALAGGHAALLNRVLASGPSVALISLGNPYLLRSFPAVAAYIAAYSTAPTAEAAVARALLGEIPIGGRLPVTIPDFAKIGDGIQLSTQGN